MNKKYIFLLIQLIISIQLVSQVKFIDKSDDILNGNKIYTAMSVAVSDINGDYYDDIVVLDQGIYLKYYLNSGDLKNFELESIGKTFEKPAWTINTGDIDNDGIAEIYTCGAQTYGNLYKKEAGNYTLIKKLTGVSYAQNSNFADINNDGFLDLFVCNENNYNAIYINDKNGNLEWENYINFRVNSNYNNFGDYGSDFIDFDDDGDIDLFITKCWAGAENADDPRRINNLYVNDGNNNYTEKAQEYGLNSGAQSWTGMFGDMDNDGDLDCFVTNHDTSHYYYENINNDTFINRTKEWFPELYCSSIQASLRDFDNNGYLDILISGDKSFIVWNEGNNKFAVEPRPFDRGEIHSFGIGDFNDDGFLDVYTSYGKGLNKYSNYKDLIWINNKNDNHWVKFSLWGRDSNRQGIGSKIKIYGTWGIQVRDARIGESYGITNSVNLNFGLGKYDKIDSMIIQWPSGISDRYFNLETDKHYLLQEGTGISPFFDIQTIGNRKFCTGDSVILQAPTGNELSYQWSTGATSKDIVVKRTGTYSVTVTNTLGQKQISHLMKTELNPVEKPVLSFIRGYKANCQGDTAILQCDDTYSSYLWSNNQTTKAVRITESGLYYAKVQGTCEEVYSDTVKVDFISAGNPSIFYTDTIHKKQRDTIVAKGDSIFWYANEFSDEAILSGDTLITGIIDRDTSFWVENVNSYKFEQQHIGLKENVEKDYGSLYTNGGLIFDGLKDFILKSVKIYSGKPGIRRFQIKNTQDSILFYSDIMVAEGEQRVNLDFHIPRGLGYKLETDKGINLANLDDISPYFFRDKKENVQFPYENDLVSIKTSYYGKNYYYYFYDWEVAEEDFECRSKRIEIPVTYDPKTLIYDLNLSPYFDIYPNPVNNYLIIQNRLGTEINIVTFNSLGEILIKTKSVDKELKLNTTDLKSGIYYLKIISGGKSYTTKFVKE